MQRDWLVLHQNQGLCSLAENGLQGELIGDKSWECGETQKKRKKEIGESRLEGYKHQEGRKVLKRNGEINEINKKSPP